MDAEIRSQEEARAQEAAEARAVAASASGRKVKEEPGQAADVGSVLKMENSDSWNATEDEGDPPKPLVHKARVETRCRRKKQRKNSKQEPVPQKKPKGHLSHTLASLEDPEAEDAKNVEISEYIRVNRKTRVKQESALKKPMAECAWTPPSSPSHNAQSEAQSPGVASGSDQDGAQEGPPTEKAMGWALARSPAPLRKKKKVSLGPVSYVLVDSEHSRKMILRKGPGTSRDASIQKALRGSQCVGLPASMSQGRKAKPEGSLHTSKGESDNRGHLGHVSGWMGEGAGLADGEAKEPRE
ncbi:hypothetical protein MC885_010718 [Smutsia gigantea]|nr:hypothetical protein MC885_010718 [Smutsia gigantea]